MQQQPFLSIKRCIVLLCIIVFLVNSSLLQAAAFTVSTLNGGTESGSLYAAITDVNTSRDPNNTITFTVSGTITLTTSLPAVSNQVTIDGFSAPGWTSLPVVTLDFNNTPGLVFSRGSDQSVVRGLSLVNASTAGVTLQSSFNTLNGNFIGLFSDGVTTVPNHANGVTIQAESSNNFIGVTNTTSISYYNSTNINIQPISAWQGLRGSTTTNIYLPTTNTYLISGTSDTNGLLFIGNIEGTEGTGMIINNPSFTKSTSIYGPDITSNNLLCLVGSGQILGDSIIYGFLFEGTTNDFNTATHYTTVYRPHSSYNFVHSAMGNFAVGNADTTNVLVGDSAYIYDIPSKSFVTNINYPNALTVTAYGIWWNGGTSYTICGGYSTNIITNLTNQQQPIGLAFLVDYDSSQSGTNAFTHWASFSYPANTNYLTHFEGISGVTNGTYTLSADSAADSTSPAQGSFVTISRKEDGSFGTATWIPLNYPGVQNILTCNSVYGNNIVGIVASTNAPSLTVQASINNVALVNNISGNLRSGIELHSSFQNVINNCILDENSAYGILATGNCSGTTLSNNIVNSNGLGSYNLMKASGIIVEP